MFHYTINEHFLTIETLLQDRWKLGKKIIHELRMSKGIEVNGAFKRWKEELNKGDIVTVHFESQPSHYIAEDDCPLPIRYEDEHCIVVSKPQGMSTHPNEEGERGTCMNYVVRHIIDGGGHYAEHVHRLDQGTEGLLLIAKHPIAKSVFDRMIEEKSIVRVYEAEVEGHIHQRSGTIKAAIGRDRHHNHRRVVSPSGQRAVTNYKVVKDLDKTTVVELILETGRTHQIRVHMAHLGHPIVGDTLYNARQTKDGRYKLHAVRLSFHHPFLNKDIVIEDK